MTGIKLFVIFSVTALYFAVMPGRIGANFFVPNAKLCQCLRKERQGLLLTVCHFVCKFRPIVCLDAFNGKRKFFYHMLNKLSGRIGALLLECLKISEPAIFIYKSILVIFLLRRFSNKANLWNIFHINLYSLPWILHFLIRFWDIFRIWQFYWVPPIRRRSLYSPETDLVYPHWRSLTQNTTKPAWGFLRRMFSTNVISSCVCCFG